MEDSKDKQKYWSALLVVPLALLVSIALVPGTTPQQDIANTARELYTTGIIRDPVVNQYCATTPLSIDQSEKDTNKMYNSSLSTYFKANATKLIESLINGRLSDFTK